MVSKDEEFQVISPGKITYEGVEVHITGFGKFGGVEVNPTSIVVSALQKVLETNPIPKLKIGSTKIITVSAVDAIQAVDEIVAAANEKAKANPKIKQVLIHFGVATKNKIFYVESKGYNVADFPNYPDEKGYKADSEVIVKGIAYNHPLESILPCSDLVFTLQGMGIPVDVSDNPGTFICNYTYYTSLYKTLPLRIPSVFVHVPAFTTIKEEDHFAFVHAFLAGIRDIYTEG